MTTSSPWPGAIWRKKPWSGSSQGKAVDVTAPAESVWRAHYNKQGHPSVGRSNGTSYAVALTAGVAAIWLAYHGREKLINDYGADQIHNVFRELLMKTANSDHQLPKNRFGAGIVDAKALLEEPLPNPANHVRRAAVLDQRLRVTVKEHRLDKQLSIDHGSLSESLAQELLSADALDAFFVPEETVRARKAAKVSPIIPTQGVSERLRKILKK